MVVIFFLAACCAVLLAWRASRVSGMLLRTTHANTVDVSVVIPLKGWDASLPSTVEHILTESYDGYVEVILVVDEEHPHLGEFPSIEGFHVIHPSRCPNGWRDKNWRMRVGVEQARYGAVLFLDSDVVAFERMLTRRARAHQGDFSFCLPLYVKPANWAEAFLATFTAQNNLFAYATGFAFGQPTTAIGPSMLCTASRDHLVEALEIIRDEMADDHTLSQALRRSGHSVHCATIPVLVAKYGANWKEVANQILRWMMLPRTVLHMLDVRTIALGATAMTVTNLPLGFMVAGAILAFWSGPIGATVALAGLALSVLDGFLLRRVQTAFTKKIGVDSTDRHPILSLLTLIAAPVWMVAALIRNQISWRGSAVSVSVGAQDDALDMGCIQSNPQINGDILSSLRHRAAVDPNAAAIVMAIRNRPGKYKTLSWAELERRSDRVAHGLVSKGLSDGVRMVLLVTPGIDLFVLVFAMFKSGAVPVLVDPGLGVGNIYRCIAEAGPVGFAGIPKAHLARKLLRWGRGTVRTRLVVGPKGFWGDVSLAELEQAASSEPFPPRQPRPDALAFIGFTNGSTGAPKGVGHTQGTLYAQAQILRDTYDLQEGGVNLATFPLFGFYAPVLGMTVVVPDMDPSRPGQADPKKLTRAIQDQGCTSIFGSPALIDRMASWALANKVTYPELAHVMCAGASVRPDILREFRKTLRDDVVFHTPYGSTEVLPATTMDAHELLHEVATRTETGAGVCIGRPVNGVDVAVIPLRSGKIASWDESLRLPPGELGEIVVRSPAGSPGYLNRPAKTAACKIPSESGAFHRMGDLGRWDEQGRLWMCGRIAHRVITPERSFESVCCEGVFNTHPDVHRTALVGVSRNGCVIPVIVYEVRSGKRPSGRMEQELLQIGHSCDVTRGITTFLHRAHLPVDVRHNAKINRIVLAQWAAERLKDATPASHLAMTVPGAIR